MTCSKILELPMPTLDRCY